MGPVGLAFVVMRTAPMLVVAAAAAVTLFAGCSSDDSSAAETTTTEIETTTTPAPATTEAAAANCTPAPDQYVSAINGSLNDSSLKLGPAFVVAGEDDVEYIGAHIMRGDERVSSADVWVAQGPAIFSLSGSAREYSMLADGRDILNVSAGDEYGSAVQQCTIRG